LQRMMRAPLQLSRFRDSILWQSHGNVYSWSSDGKESSRRALHL
jgi:hypothetical protein